VMLEGRDLVMTMVTLHLGQILSGGRSSVVATMSLN
jgi:hypothetical protein